MHASSYKQIYADILTIIAEVRSEPISKLNLETTINNDLDTYGDDWDDVIEPILKKYPIDDWSEFVFLNHMSGEGYREPLYIINALVFIPKLVIGCIVFLFNTEKSVAVFQYKPFKEVQYKNDPLYIADIFNSAIKGKWEYAKDSDLNLHELIK
ncbi:hypothetical protein [Cytophaga aurantiaca]|uniref:hypothetical protein n=1 Tax=Cytophaga aurantiaca TaxID=29530 RepID=UPI00036A5C44|nr:hypothetical protein [Cytophaga aurantiaca]